MNPIGIHYGYWTQYWNSDPIQFVGRAQKCGFDVLEVNAPKITRMSDQEREALKGAAENAGLGLTYSIGLKDDMDLASEDAATRKKGVAFLQDVARAMKYFGGTIMAGINYSSWPRKLAPDKTSSVVDVAPNRSTILFLLGSAVRGAPRRTDVDKPAELRIKRRVSPHRIR